MAYHIDHSTPPAGLPGYAGPPRQREQPPGFQADLTDSSNEDIEDSPRTALCRLRERYRREKEEVQDWLEQLADRLENVADRNDELKDQTRRLQDERQSLEGQLQQLQFENARLRSDVGGLRAELTAVWHCFLPRRA